MSQRDSLTSERLRALLSYDPATGTFTRRISRCRWRAGETAGAPNRGYVQIKIDNVLHAAHRLAWLHTTGSWPTGDIDHIDGNRSNNAFANLRDVTRGINAQNLRRARRDSQSGLLGSFKKKDRKQKDRWQAQISLNGVLHYIGIYDTAEEAHAAYVAAKRRMHVGNTI